MTIKPPRRPPNGTAPAGEAIVFESAPKATAQRIGIYGPGGIGKTSLAASAPGPVAFVDLDGSLGLLGLNVKRTPEVIIWEQLRDMLHAPGWDGIRTLVIDSATRAEELAVEWTIRNIGHEKGYAVKRIEDYGYGKGYSHVFDTFLQFLGDLEAHIRAGRNVVLVMHDCTAAFPNPMGEDYVRYEPRLQNPGSGKASIRLRLREWLDHLLFLGYDIAVENGKASGAGTRTIYPNETPFAMAKTRRLDESIPFDRGSDELWRRLFPEHFTEEKKS